MGAPQEELAYIRQFVGLSDEEVSRLFGVTPETVRAWFATGDVPDADAERIRQVADRVRRSGADPTRLHIAEELTAPREELDGRTILEQSAGGRPDADSAPRRAPS
jgi:transcriptional regulator with XRE-family HTH domain